MMNLLGFKYLFILAFLTLFQRTVKTIQNEEFSEELAIRRLQTGDIHSFFQYRTAVALSEDVFIHYDLFPKSFGQIIKKYNIQELHLSLTHGYWHTEKWGYPVTVAPPGAELWVWFSSTLSEDSVDAQWTGLVNALSGQFCASLNFITKSLSVTPQLSFKPLGLWPVDTVNSTKFLRYATLPRENVCTENLTPWKKLLPCQGKAGLSTLLDALVLYDTAYHSLGVHLRSVCKDDDCIEVSLELKQTLSTVHDAISSNVQHGWLLSRFYGRTLQSRCPMAKVSKILIETSTNKEDGVPDPEPTGYEQIEMNGINFTYAVYNLKKINFAHGLNIAVRYGAKPHLGIIKRPYISAERHLVGYGGEFGGIVSTITNTHPSKNIKVIYLAVFPWFVRIFIHTLKVTVDKTSVVKNYLKYEPSKDRIRPTMIEMVLEIPANRRVTISVDYEKAFLKWTEHPPDSHHGFYIGSSVVSTVMPSSLNISGFSERCELLSNLRLCRDLDKQFIRLYSRPLLVVLPTPDFSMPYNVICLTCTILAIAFGGLFNAATKEIVVVSKKPKSLKQRTLAALYRLWARMKKKKTD